MTDPSNSAPAIFGAIARVSDGLGRLAKDGRGPSSQGAYPFLKVDSLVERLQPLFAEHGVVTIGNQSEVEQVTYRFPKVTLDGTPVHDGRPDAFQIITRLRYEVTFLSPEDGSSVTASAYGESADTGDKGLRRASTAAFKEVLLRTFTVVAGEEDPDAQDPNDQPAQVVRQDRGAQARERAAGGTRKRGERAPRAAREEQSDATVEEAAPADSPVTGPKDTTSAGDAAAPEAGPAPSAAERRAAAAAARKRPEATPAPSAQPEQPAFEVDPADVAHAEATQPPARVPSTPLGKPVAETKADQRYESVADIRKAIREALAERGLDRDYVNALGDQITGKERGNWFASLPDLHVVLKAIVNGEAAGGDEAGF